MCFLPPSGCLEIQFTRAQSLQKESSKTNPVYIEMGLPRSDADLVKGDLNSGKKRSSDGYAPKYYEVITLAFSHEKQNFCMQHLVCFFVACGIKKNRSRTGSFFKQSSWRQVYL